jgi:DNA-binding MltR family transcriptional regulator
MVARLLHRYFVSVQAAEKLLGQAGALGTFASRIDLAFALGLVPEPTYKDLHTVREIGNYFAHHIEASTFDKSPVKDWCDAFWVGKNKT